MAAGLEERHDGSEADSDGGQGAGSNVLPPGKSYAVGAQRIGPYRLIQPLGEGGMGIVHLALEPNGRAVAIKVLREHIAHDREARDRLRREVETLTLVQDARVAAVLDADTEGPRPYIVTRYIPGPPLDSVVADTGPLHGDELLRLGRGLWGALKAIHGAGVIHRDLKPGNVLLLDGDPVVIDFGIAHVADDIRLTMTGLVMGTPGYLSPEIIAGAPVTEATDWWGWAATLAFAASGAPPFGRGPMPVILDRLRRGQADLSGVDQALLPLLRAALSPVPTERPHADEIVKALDLYAAGVPATLAIPVNGAPPTRKYAADFAPASTAMAAPRLDKAPEPDWVWDRSPASATAQSSAPASAGPASAGPDRGADPWAEWDRGQQEEQRESRSGRRFRVGLVPALSAGVLGVSVVWPMLALALVVLWSWCARFADRSVRSLVMRRHDRGHRRSDVPIAIVASPWHAVVAALSVVLTLLVPAVVAVGATFSTALVAAAVTGTDPAPNSTLPLLAGGLLGLLMLWWGPGSGSMQRGTRSLLRAGAFGDAGPDLVALTDFLVATFALIGAGLGIWHAVRHGQPDWWPLSVEGFPALARHL
jgi:serine/threonine protein kinase